MIPTSTGRLPAWLIVLERGANWPRWFDHHHAAEDTTVVMQQPGQSTRSLLLRVEKAVADLTASGHSVRRAVLAVRVGGAPVLRTERAKLARALLRAVCGNSGSLVIDAPGAGGDERHELLALSGALLPLLAGSGIELRVELEPVSVYRRPARKYSGETNREAVNVPSRVVEA